MGSLPHSSSCLLVLSLDGDTARQNGTNIQAIITTGDTPQLDHIHGTIQQPALPTGHLVRAQTIPPGSVMAVSSMATAKVLIRAEGDGVTQQDGTVAAEIFRDPRGIPTTPGHMRLATTTPTTTLHAATTV